MKSRRGVLYLADLNPRRGTEPGKVRFGIDLEALREDR